VIYKIAKEALLKRILKASSIRTASIPNYNSFRLF
jgi:hypothetical protein